MNYQGKIQLSGRFLVNLIDNKYPQLELIRVKNEGDVICRKIGYELLNPQFELIINQDGTWYVKGNGEQYYNRLSEFITTYIAHLIAKVKDPKLRSDITKALSQSYYSHHESYIIITEVLVSCAIKNPEILPYYLQLLQSLRTKYRLNNSNAPYVLLTMLYGGKMPSSAIVSSFTGSLGIYYFRKPERYAEDIQRVLEYPNEQALAKIQEQILSLKPTTYAKYLGEE